MWPEGEAPQSVGSSQSGLDETYHKVYMLAAGMATAMKRNRQDYEASEFVSKVLNCKTHDDVLDLMIEQIDKM